MIANEKELEHTIKAIAKMYAQRDREQAETLWHPSTREAIVEGTVSMIRKLEREIAEYLAKKYDLVPKQTEPVRSPKEKGQKKELVASK